jgi:hypothetical protein
MPPDGILDQVLADFTTAANSYFPMILIDAERILTAVVVVQFCFLAIQAGRTWDLLGWVETFLFGIIRIALVRVVLDNLWTWGNGLFETGREIGLAISGQSPDVMTPSGIFTLGLNMIGIIWGARSRGWVPSCSSSSRSRKLPSPQSESSCSGHCWKVSFTSSRGRSYCVGPPSTSPGRVCCAGASGF